MKLKNLLLIFLFNAIFTLSQISNFEEKFELPVAVKETSGLLFLDAKVITHNDSGDSPNLYEIDSLSGKLIRTVSISNAKNVDWEDISENDTHIFIADIGNNNGNRKNLKIYKILKSDFRNNLNVSAEIISFSYEDQVDFSYKPYNSNFDAEAIVIYGNDILVFTKNWADLQTNIYKIPLTTGNYIAKKISSANIEGLITGAVYNDNRFILTGYTTALIPFLIYVSPNRKPGNDIFFSSFNKISLENELGKGNQVEGITNIGFTGKYYLSREKNISTISGTRVTHSQKLYKFHDTTHSLLSLEKNDIEFLKIIPNPIVDKISFETNWCFSKIDVFNLTGKKVYSENLNHLKEIDISFLSKGIYYLKVQFENSKTVVKKIIKL